MSIQDWVQQPSLEEIENILVSHESLAKQMIEIKLEKDQCILVAQVKENDARDKFGGYVEPSTK